MWRAFFGLAVLLTIPALLVLRPGNVPDIAFVIGVCSITALGFVALAGRNGSERYRWPDGEPHA
jgi:hypothetical protein